MSASKKHEHLRKNQAFMAPFVYSRPSFSSGDERISKFPTLPEALNNRTRFSNPTPSLIAFETRKYSENDLQQILTMILEAQLLPVHG